MSGHSKWSSIKHKKAAADARRSKVFTKLIKEITVAARLGGGDPEANPRLRLALVNARAANMPHDTVNRAIAKGTGGTEGSSYETVIYEGYGPANVAVIIEALTDNRNRTVAAIRHAFSRYNAKLGESNTVQFMFDQKGTFTIPRDAIDEDALTEHLLEAGAEDLQDTGEMHLVICAVEQFDAVRGYLESHGIPIAEAGLSHLPRTKVVIDDMEQAEKVITFLDALEDDDDVQKVYSNFDVPEEVLARLAS